MLLSPRRSLRLADAQGRIGREINPVVYSRAEFSAKIGLGHHFLQNVLNGEKIFLIGDERELARMAEERLADGT